MNKINTRVLNEAYYMKESRDTIREVAKVFKVSKSTVHKDLQERLKKVNSNLYKDITEISSINMHLNLLRF